MTPNVSRNSKIAIFVVITLVFAGALLGPAISMMQGDQSETLQQDQGVSEHLKGPLHVNALSVNETAGDALLRVTDRDAGSMINQTVSDGSTVTFQMPDGNVDVTVESIPDNSSTTVAYEYPHDYGWSQGAKSVWTLIPILAILGVVVIFGGLGMKEL